MLTGKKPPVLGTCWNGGGLSLSMRLAEARKGKV